MVVNNASLRRVDGNILLPTFSMTLGLDVDSWTWSFSAALPGRALSDLEPAGTGSPVEVEATINGTVFRALVESIERSREFGTNDLRISGRGKTALLDAPYAPVLSFTNTQARTAQQIMGDVLTFNGVSLGWSIQWGLADWSIPAGVFSHQGSYIGALNKIALAAGGCIQPHAASQLIKVLPRYPRVPWGWATVTPDFQLPADVTSRESLRWLEKAAYNRVFVSGQEVGVLGQVTRSGTAGDVLAPMVVDALITDAVVARQRGIAVLSDTGRQVEVSLRLPVLSETGIITPGAFVDYQDGGVTRRGMVRSTQVQAGLPEVWQTLGVQTYA
jgi:prophage tail gpP-like protein